MVESSNTNDYHSCPGVSRRRAEFTSPDSPADKVLKSSAASVQVTTVDSQQNLKPQLPLLSSSTIDYEEHAEETKGIILCLFHMDS